MNEHESRILFPKSKLKDFIIILSLYVIGILFVVVVNPSYIVNILVVYIPGLVYLFWKLKNSKKKILLFGIASILFIIPIEILARATDSWDVLSTFPRVLSIAPIENMFYGLINVMFPIAFYEYFYDGDRDNKISERGKILILIFLVLFSITVFIYTFLPSLLHLNYWLLGVIILIPNFALLAIYKRHILKRLILPAIVFGSMYFIHELVSMELGHWWWPGQYLLPIQINGLIYPLEDFVIWILFSNIAVISGYEVMWD